MTTDALYASTKSTATFLDFLNNKADVLNVTETSRGVFLVSRRNMAEVVARLVDLYTVSESDVRQLINDHPEVDAIVTASTWNGYTSQAKALAAAHGVGLFTFREFMGAVHHEGDDFLGLSR